MKKFLAIVLSATLLFFSAEAALASVPHCHGHDFDHSKHRECPVHQIELHGPDFATGDVPAVIFASPSFFIFESLTAENFARPSRALFSTRAPPAAV